jgi:tetratricopeptide (TPR) repeat protein
MINLKIKLGIKLKLIYFFVGLNIYFVSFSFSNNISKSEKLKADSIQVIQLIESAKSELGRDYIKAIQLANNAKIIAEKRSEPRLILLSTLQLGKIYFYLGQYEKATSFFTEILQIATKNKDNEWIGRGYYQLGSIRLVMEDYALAKNHILKAKEFYLLKYKTFDQISLENKIGLHNNLGVVFSGLGELEFAKKEFQDGIALIEGRADFVFSLTQLFNNLGDVYFKLGDFTNAFKYYHKAEDQVHQNGHDQLAAMVNISLGKAFKTQENFNEALKYFREALFLAKGFQGYSHLKHAAAGLSEVFEEVSQKDSALHYLQLSKTYQDSLGIKKTSEKILAEEMLLEFSEEKSNLEKFYEQYKTFLFGIIILLLIATLVGLNRLLSINGYLQNMETEKISLKNLTVNVQVENEGLKDSVEQIKKDMTLMSMKAIQKDDTIKQILDTVTKKKDPSKPIGQNELDRLMRELKINHDHNVLSEFEMRFSNIYVGFFEKIMQQFPNLTLNDRRLSAFLKLQLTTKEIAAITGQSVRAVELSRIRLRKKIALTNSSKSLNDFFLEF